MKCLTALLLLAAVASASEIDTFRRWARAHGKVYTASEEARRFAVFKENVAVIERLNLEGHGARFAPNKFTDLTNEEFGAAFTTTWRRAPSAANAALDVIPDSVTASADYKYMLPPVKNQASCGSCWAFSAVANMEAQTYMHNGGKVVSLSEQQLVSCDTTDTGCDGGLPVTADEYAVEAGMASEDAYPYVSGSGSVPKCKSFEVVARFKSFEEFGHVRSDQTVIEHLEKYGPLSIGIQGSSQVFQSYSGGVLDSTACGTTLDHGVALVGYGTDSATGVNYWTVRNSWGDDWGEQGYVRFIRGKNQCGMNLDMSTIKA